MLKKMKSQSISLIYLTIIIIYLDHFLNNTEKVNLRQNRFSSRGSQTNRFSAKIYAYKIRSKFFGSSQSSLIIICSLTVSRGVFRTLSNI